MKILITGIHGFVGSNLVKAFASKHTIYGLDIVAPVREGIVATFSWDDLRQGNIPPVDAIIHLAGKAHDTQNSSAAQEYFDINTGLTQRIFDYFTESTARSFVFFSSVKAAADSVAGEELTEDVIPAPKGAYGESKIAAEEYIRARVNIDDNRVYTLPDDKRVYILRPCMIHGPGNKGNLNLLYKVVQYGMPWPLGAFDNKRTFTGIDNLCFVVEELIKGYVPGGVYHMSDDTGISTNELIKLICKVKGKKAYIWKLNKRMMTFIARCGTVLHLPLNSERLRKLTENYVVSNRKLKAALGIKSMPMTAQESLLITIKSFENRKQ